MKTLVTGGAGFIGSHLCERLVDLRHEVTALDNLSITSQNLPALKEKGLKVTIADITDFDKMLSETKGFDRVFHLAAMNRAVKSINDPMKANLVNITGTLNVLEACRRNGVKKVIYSSSSSIYGFSKEFPRLETQLPMPSHPYAVGKLAGEHYMNVYNSLYGIKTVNLRYFSVYGPRQLGTIEYAAVIPKFIDRIMKGEDLEIYGDGSSTRNFTYVGDVVDATIKAAEAGKAVGETINISCIEEISVMSLIRLIEKLTGKKAKIRHAPEIKGEILANPADISKAKKILNFEAKTSMEQGIKKAIEWRRVNYGK